MLHFVQQPQPEDSVVKELLHFVQQSRSGGGVMTELLHLRQDFKLSITYENSRPHRKQPFCHTLNY